MSSSSGLCNSIQSGKSPSESERVESLFDMISLILGRADESVVKLQAKIVESLIDKGVNAVASDSKSGNYMTFDILSYTPGSKWLRFLDMPGLNIILTIMGAEYNSDLSLGWNLHMPALERDFNMFKNPENDPSGFFGLFKNADKRNMKYAGPKIAKSVMKKKK